MAEMKKPTQAEIEEGLKLLQKKRERLEKIRSGELKGSVPMSVLKEANPELYEKRKQQNRFNATKRQMIIELAIKKGLDKEVSDKMIEERMAKGSAS